MSEYQFFNIKMNGVSLGIFAGSSPADAVLEMSADADLGAPHDVLLRALREAGVKRTKYALVVDDLITHRDDLDLAAAEFLKLPGVEFECLSGFSAAQLNAVARGKGFADWRDFLLVQADRNGFWASKTLAKDLLRAAREA